MADSDVTVRIRAIDEATPVLKRLQYRLWWYQWSPTVVMALAVVALVLAFCLGIAVGLLVL